MDEYRLSRHRFKELKHFCLQYPEWKRRLSELDAVFYPTDKTAVERAYLQYNIWLIEKTAEETSMVYKDSILRSVTEDISNRILGYPIEYLRVKFFWLLSEKK